MSDIVIVGFGEVQIPHKQWALLVKFPQPSDSQATGKMSDFPVGVQSIMSEILMQFVLMLSLSSVYPWFLSVVTSR